VCSSPWRSWKARAPPSSVASASSRSASPVSCRRSSATAPANAARRASTSPGAGERERGEALQRLRVVVVAARLSADDRVDRVEVGGALGELRGDGGGAGVVEGGEPGPEGVALGLLRPRAPASLEPRLAQPRGERVELLEPEDGRERLVQRGRAAGEHRPELVVGQQRAEALERRLPPERRPRVARARDLHRLASVQRGAGRPAAAQVERRRLAVDVEAGGQGRRAGAVQVAPALAPDLRLVLPAQVAPREQQLEPLGEARLARAVAADDEREPGTGRERQAGARADPAEALDVDVLEVHPRGLGRRVGRGRLAPRGRRLAREVAVEGLRAVGGGEDDVDDGRRRRVVAAEPVDELLVREVVHPVSVGDRAPAT
jgi:hypothetical protein